MTLLSLQNLTVHRATCPVVDDVSLRIEKGECIGLIGPNGAGKTTLMRAALGLQEHTGTSDLAQMTPRARAARAAWLPQMREIAWPVTVETLVALGRLPHLLRGGLRSQDAAAVDAALDHMSLNDFRTRRATELSGGEQARALIARALAQETPLLMADEPVAGLDPAAQIATLQVFAGLAQTGRAVVVSLHDLGLAARYCTRLIVMNTGRVIADGAPQDVLTPEVLAQVFGLDAALETGAHGRDIRIKGLSA